MIDMIDKPLAQSMGGKSNDISVVVTGKAKSIPFREGMTLGEALDEAGVTLEATDEARVNGTEAPDQDMKLSAGDQVMVIQEIEGAH